jgi:hypothetical protein
MVIEDRPEGPDVTPDRAGKERHQIPAEAALAGILALLVEEREGRVEDDRSVRKIEPLLADAGLSIEDIVAVTGKNPGAVRKSIQRDRTR